METVQAEVQDGGSHPETDVPPDREPATVIRLLLPLLLVVPAPPGAAPDRPTAGPPDACSDPASHRFDFWPGNWSVESRVRNADDSWTETTGTWTVREVLGGCAIVDFARGDFGRGPMRGMGARYYEPGSGQWHVTWLSTRSPGRLGVWTGGFGREGVGTFLREVDAPDETVLSRIRWWDLRADAAEWDHAVSRDGGESWRTTWRMSFRRRDPAERIRALVEAYDRAADRKDRGRLEELTGEAFVYFTSGGEVRGRRAFLDFLTSSRYRPEHRRRTGVRVRLTGSTAVVESRWRGRGTYAGRPFEDDQRCSLVFGRVDGRWRLASEHCTPRRE